MSKSAGSLLGVHLLWRSWSGVVLPPLSSLELGLTGTGLGGAELETRLTGLQGGQNEFSKVCPGDGWSPIR